MLLPAKPTNMTGLTLITDGLPGALQNAPMTSNTPIGHKQSFLENVNILGVEVILFDFFI